MLFSFIAALSIAYLIEVWINSSNTLVEYAIVFNFTHLFKIQYYLSLVKDGYDKSYLEFLIEYYDCFFTKLIKCPTCLSFWLSLIVCFLGFHILYIFSTAFLALLFFRILNKML